MSLQVWLPLNGSLENQGLDGTVTLAQNTGATIDNGGKIGKCYSFDASNDWIQYNIDKTKYGNKPISYSYWFKCDQNDAGGAILDLAADLVAGYTYSSNGIKFTYWRCWSNSGTRTGDSGTTPNFYNANIWHHIAVIFNANINQIYVDGILALTEDKSSKYTTYWTPLLGTSYNKFSIGKSAGDSNWIGGKVNDVRIYDHALSDKEVEEIAKGLVLHYKLDDPASIERTTNLCNGATCGTQASAASPATWGAHKYYTVLEDTTANDPVPFQKKSVMTIDFNTSYGSGGGASVYPPTSFNIEPSTTYIYSRYIKPSDNFAYTHANFLYRYEYASGGGTRLVEGGVFNKTNTEYLGNGWYRCWGSFTSQATAATVTLPFYTYPGKSITYELGGIQLEKNTHMTPYIISSNTPMIIDSSGYGNYGIITGDIKTDNNSIKYGCSIKQASGQYIRVEKHPVECMPKDAITVNLWQYATSWYNPISCTEGGGWNFENSNGIRFPVYISGVGYKVAQSSITTASTLNSWHMLTGTMDKDNIKIYYDGQEVGTVVNGSTNGIGYANNYIFIGGEAQGNSTSPASSAYVGNLSDVRIYATALTPEQILELYNTSATIDNKGNIYARELVEK